MTLKDIAKQKGLMFNDHLKFNSLDIKTANNGNNYGVGIAFDLYGNKHAIKVWDKTVLETLDNALKQGPIVILKVTGSTDVYKDSFSLIINQLLNPDPGIDATAFLVTPNSVKDLMGRLSGVYKNQVSPKGLEIISSILTGNVAKRFTEEFAASSVHDASRHGLLAHTTKMMEIGVLIKNQHPDLLASQDEVDLFFIGLLAHDIGKIMEYAYGVRTEVGFVSHQVLGLEFINAERASITEKYSEDWYYHLVSILTQHHGVYGLRPQSTISYLVHLVDMFETQLTIVTEKIVEDRPLGKTMVFADSERLYLTHPKL